MFKFLPVIFWGIFFFFLTTPTALAQIPSRYYDWSTTLEVHSSKVLGLDTNSQEATPTATSNAGSVHKSSVQDFTRFNRYFLVGNLTSDSPFHFAKTLQESVQLALTFNPEQKEKMRLSIAGSRLAEMQQIANQSGTRGLDRAANSYGQLMNTATENILAFKGNNQATKDLTAEIEEETAKHTVVLENVAVKVPEKARESVKKAIEASWKGTDAAADLAGRPAVPADMIIRLQSLKAQGLLTAEEVNKLIGTRTRTEARQEIKKYVKEGVVPEADFLRMNENVKSFYQDDFFKIHEMKRFYEMKKLESEKPDEATLKKIQDFAKTYQPGEVVPADFRKYWVPIIRLEEIQNTIRPDLIDAELMKNNEEDYKRFNEIVERYKPRPEDMAYLDNFLKKNPNTTLPPEYERMRGLGEKYGAQCGSGSHWITQPQGGGICVPDGQDEGQWRNMPGTGNNSQGKACNGMIVAAKGSGGVCGTYPADCVPTGWSRANSCSEPGSRSETEARSQAIRTCPTNSHWVPVGYMPDGGYCIPNYTAVSSGQTGDQPCTTGYYRNYAGGPCLASYDGANVRSLTPITLSPGPYPNPYYGGEQRCGNGSHWVSEPINPNGGYCASNYYGSMGGGGTVVSDCPTGQYRGPGGFCTSQEKSGEAWNCIQAGKYWNGTNCQAAPPPSTPTSGGSTSINCQLRSCPEGQYVDQMSCSCRKPGENPYPSACTPPASGCQGGSYWNSSTCSCFYPPTTSGTSGSGSVSVGGNCSVPPSCGAGYYVDYGTCSCRSSSQPSNSQPPPNTSCIPPSSGCPGGYYFNSSTCTCNPSSSSQTNQPPPAGYGSCSAGQYWNGTSCQTSTPPSPSSASQPPTNTSCVPPSSGCPGGSSFNSANCTCESSSNQTPPPPQNQPQPPQEQPQQQPPTNTSCVPPSSGCPGGSSFNSANCTCESS